MRTDLYMKLHTELGRLCSYKHRHFENTKLLAGNDHVIDIFTSEDMENIHRNIRPRMRAPILFQVNK